MERACFFINLLCFGMSIKLSSIQVRSQTIDDTIDFCETKSFEPECGPDEVIVMKSAVFGRMKQGICVMTDYGYVGCQVDVLREIDKECSGRRTCSVLVPNENLVETMDRVRKGKQNSKACPPDLNMYLSVSYKCVKVESDACHTCASNDMSKTAKVTTEEGYIGGVVTKEDHNKCGTARCPWTIEVKPGQNINVSIYDFGGQQQYSLPSTCFRFGYIKEKSAPRDTPLCAEQQRFRHVYTSVSHSIQLQVVSPEALVNRGQFIVHYQAVGCPDHMVDDTMWTRRVGDKLEVGCIADSGQKWELICDKTEWRGPLHVCPAPGPTEPPEVMTLPLVVLIAIVVAIALVVGVLILTIGVVFLKRQHSTRMHGSYYYRTRHEYDYPMGAIGQPETYVAPKSSTGPTEPSKYQPVMPQVNTQQRTGLHHPQNWYKRMGMEQRPLPSLPNIAEASGGSASTVSRSDDDPQQMHAAEVHRSDSDRERRYLTNPRPSAARLQQQQPTTAANMSANPPNQAVGIVIMGGGGNRKIPTKDGPPQYFVLDDGPKDGESAAAIARREARAANARAAAAILEQQEDGGSSEKSPEEENEENDSKEFSRNNSWHEITLRPTRVNGARAAAAAVTNNVNNTSTENTTGKTSWP